VLCQCSRPTSPLEPFHALDCHHSRAIINHRHDSVQHLLVRLILRTYSHLPDFEMRTNYTLPQQSPHNTTIVDVFLRYGSTVYLIDIGITNPSSPSGRSLGSHLFPDVANLAYEAAKCRTYSFIGFPAIVVPFIIEATGRLGPAAHAFLTVLLQSNHNGSHDSHHFLDQVNTTLAQFSGLCVAQTRSHSTAANPLIPPSLAVATALAASAYLRAEGEVSFSQRHEGSIRLARSSTGLAVMGRPMGTTAS
jgi:hypothetical protein